AVRGADAVRAGVAAADDDDVLALGEDRLDVGERLVGDAPVLLGQEFHGEVDAVEVAALDWQIARLFGTAREDYGVVLFDQFVDGDDVADMDAGMQHHALGLHLFGAAVDQVLFHLEIGDAVAEQAPDLGVLLIQMHLVAGAGELLRAGEARRARGGHGDGLAGLFRVRLRGDPAFSPALVDDRAFDRLDGDGHVLDVQRAARLAGGGADAAGELREVVGGVKVPERLQPFAAIDEVVPVRDLVVHRTAGVTVGHAAIHAA